ncbi:MAG: hypothetical protein IKW90_11210 [Lachnospiraceae bacterium]|nr:hypothetical protein [Lachnospiraceae bacterium]MBR6402834.1 hypothetical protein [Eubacterium sp.]
MKLTREEQETIITFNAKDKNATIYTRDPMVMREVDSLVIGYPDVFKCVAMSDIDKTYEMPKTAVSYRKPRRLSEEQREMARKRIGKINKTVDK